jgi:hypothetical protein
VSKCQVCGGQLKRGAKKYCSTACWNTRRSYTDERRELAFLAKTSRSESGCWAWIGTKDRQGYGRFGMGGRSNTQPAHRFAYERWVGPVPADAVIRHKCHNRSCVNPDHLELGTQKQNMGDTKDLVIKAQLYDRMRHVGLVPEQYLYPLPPPPAGAPSGPPPEAV